VNSVDHSETFVLTPDVLHSSLDDAAKIIGQQRQTISELREALLSAQAWVGHWQRDVEGRCMPTPESLAQAYAEIGSALDHTSDAHVFVGFGETCKRCGQNWRNSIHSRNALKTGEAK